MSRVTVYYKDETGQTRKRSFDSSCFTFEDDASGRRVHFVDYPAGGYFSNADDRPTLTISGNEGGVLAVNSVKVVMDLRGASME